MKRTALTAFTMLLLALHGAMPLPALAARGAATGPEASPRPAVATSSDQAIGQRLDARLSTITGLDDVRAAVVAGVVVLEGQVVREDQRKLAEVIASQMQGVSKVENRIALSSRLRDRFEVALQTANDKLLRLVAAAPLLLVALVILYVAVQLGRLVYRRPQWLRPVRSSNPYMEGLIQRLLQWLITLAGILLALDLLGATSLVGAVLGSAGVVGLVVGFAFKDIAENYVAGILLSLRRPFAPGDHLVIDRVHEGKVVALTARTTLLMTLDGNQISLPNALVFKSVVLNYTQNPMRRFDFLVPLDPSASVGDAQREGLAAIERVEGVLADPAPYALVFEYLHDRLSVQFLGWVDQTRNSLNRVRSEAMRASKGALDRAGIRRAGTPARTPTQARIAPVAQERDRGPAPDTSVDRDIDQQLADAQRANDADNLLEPQKPGTPVPAASIPKS